MLVWLNGNDAEWSVSGGGAVGGPVGSGRVRTVLEAAAQRLYRPTPPIDRPAPRFMTAIQRRPRRKLPAVPLPWRYAPP